MSAAVTEEARWCSAAWTVALAILRVGARVFLPPPGDSRNEFLQPPHNSAGGEASPGLPPPHTLRAPLSPKRFALAESAPQKARMQLHEYWDWVPKAFQQHPHGIPRKKTAFY